MAVAAPTVAAPAAPVTAGDRLSATLLYALALHLAVILGLDFDLRLVREGSFEPDLEITLVDPVRETEPQQADYLAQVNSAGGGELEDKAMPTTRVARESDDPRQRPGEAVVDRVPAPQPVLPQPAELTTPAPAPRETAAPVDPVEAVPPVRQPSATQLLRSSREIARLSAQLAEQTQQYARRPRKRFVSAATKAYEYAAYMEAWRAKVERVGNMNYPRSVRSNGVSGSLRLAVELLPDGSVHGISVRRSSGHPVLDAAAVRIVRLAAPYAPFPDQIREKTDILVITRTWIFDAGHQLSSR